MTKTKTMTMTGKIRYMPPPLDYIVSHTHEQKGPIANKLPIANATRDL